MTEQDFKPTETDLEFIDLYKDILPDRVFDAHMHFWTGETLPGFYGKDNVFFRSAAGPEEYMRDMAPMLPGVGFVRLNMMTMLDPAMADLRGGLRDKANAHIYEILEKYPQHTGAPYILPSDTEEDIEAMVLRTGIRCIKCYGYALGKWDIQDVTIPEFLPEAAWAVAEQRHLPIILHMNRRAALSDPRNFDYIERMTDKYRNAQLILAHCAYSFASWTGVFSIRKLVDRDNIWFDMSAICEPSPIMACIIKTAGKRLLWGSDYPNSMYRGRAVSLGYGQNWLLGNDLRDDKKVFIGAESLMALKQAAVLLDLDRTQLEDIFFRNAERLFG